MIKKRLSSIIMQNKKASICLLLVMVVIIFNLPLIIKNDYMGDDISYHVYRIQGIADSISNGDFRALIHPNLLNGYGYGSGLFYSNFFIYLPGLLCYIGLSAYKSYKILILFLTLASTFTMYYSCKEILKSKKAATIATILWQTSMHWFCIVYSRAALGEIVSLVFIPLVVLALYRLLITKRKSYILLSISISGLILGHIISFLITCGLILVVIIINIKKIIKDKTIILDLLKSIVIVILCTSFFTIPLIEQYISIDLNVKHGTIFGVPSQNTIKNFFFGVIIDKLGYPPGVGCVFLISTVIYVITIIKDKKKSDKFINFCLIFSYVIAIIQTNIFPWKVLDRYMMWLQFPWRLMNYETLLLSIASGEILFTFLKDSKKFYLNISIIIAYLIIILYYNITSIFLNWTWHYGELSKIGGGKEYLAYNYNLSNCNSILTPYSKSRINIKTYKDKVKWLIEYNQIENNNKTVVMVPFTYYKGYVAINEKKEKMELFEEEGIVAIRIIDTKGAITVYYEGTVLQKISLIVSVISLLSLIFYEVRMNKVENKK